LNVKKSDRNVNEASRRSHLRSNLYFHQSNSQLLHRTTSL